jgi:hypothetical protein
MDLLIELIKAIVEAFENRKKPQPETVPAEAFPDRSQEVYEAQQRIQQKQDALNQQRALAAKALADAAAEQHQQQQAKVAAAAARASRAAAGPQRFARLLRQPATMREVLILNELLRPPKALRRGQR